MDQRTRNRSTASIIGICALTLLSGCTTFAKKEPTITTKSKTELAVEAIQDELLVTCEGMPPAPPNSVGSLLDDGTVSMLLLGQCMARQRELVVYLKPIVDAERKKK